MRSDDKNEPEQEAVRAGVRFIQSAYHRHRVQTRSNNPRSQQKRTIKKGYAADKRRKMKVAKAATKVRKNHKGIFIIGMIVIALFLLVNIISSFSVLLQSGLGVLNLSTFPSDDEELLAAEAKYSEMEGDLMDMIDTYETAHDYDEYRYDIDSIGHDPYTLASILSAIHDEFMLAEVQDTLDLLFSEQYSITDFITTETRTGRENVEYEYTICTVTLKAINLESIADEILTDKQKELYSLYLETRGNKPNLF